MEDLLKLVCAYRLTDSLNERLRLADQIFPAIEPDLRFFVFKTIQQPAADDVLQNVLMSIARSLESFKGSKLGQFWEWCYKIARRRIYDHLRKKKSDRLQPMLPEEIIKEADISMQVEPVSSEVRDELEYALRLLKRSKPECVEYLRNFYFLGMDKKDFAQEYDITEATGRMRIKRCLEKARSLVA